VTQQDLTWLQKAKKARADKLFLSFVEETIGALLLGLLAVVCFICIVTLPAQAVFESAYWFKFGSLANFDWYDLVGHQYLDRWTSSDFAGMNKILMWAFDAWISIVPSFAGIFIPVVVAASRNQR